MINILYDQIFYKSFLDFINLLSYEFYKLFYKVILYLIHNYLNHSD